MDLNYSDDERSFRAEVLAWLRANPGPATLKLEANTKSVNARNVIAQTKTGSAQNVVMVGAHLDSAGGPGINDNGTGVRGDMKAVISAILLDPEARRRSYTLLAQQLGLTQHVSVAAK